MANRIIRNWTASEAIDKLSEGAEMFFTRLIMTADDFGCYYGHPKLLKSALFPLRDYSSEKITKWIGECVKSGIIQRYVVDGKDYIKIINFGQRLRNMNSKFPQPHEGISQTLDSTPPSIDSESRTTDSTPPPELEVEVETKKKQKPETETNTAVAVPFVGKVLDSWNEWVQHRKEKRAALTPSTIKKQIQFLGGRGDPEIIEIINRSIEKGWTGLFELNGNTNGHTKATTRTTGPDAIIEAGKDFGTDQGFQ